MKTIGIFVLIVAAWVAIVPRVLVMAGHTEIAVRTVPNFLFPTMKTTAPVFGIELGQSKNEVSEIILASQDIDLDSCGDPELNDDSSPDTRHFVVLRSDDEVAQCLNYNSWIVFHNEFGISAIFEFSDGVVAQTLLRGHEIVF